MVEGYEYRRVVVVLQPAWSARRCRRRGVHRQRRGGPQAARPRPEGGNEPSRDRSSRCRSRRGNRHDSPVGARRAWPVADRNSPPAARRRSTSLEAVPAPVDEGIRDELRHFLITRSPHTRFAVNGVRTLVVLVVSAAWERRRERFDPLRCLDRRRLRAGCAQKERRWGRRQIGTLHGSDVYQRSSIKFRSCSGELNTCCAR